MPYIAVTQRTTYLLMDGSRTLMERSAVVRETIVTSIAISRAAIADSEVLLARCKPSEYKIPLGKTPVSQN